MERFRSWWCLDVICIPPLTEVGEGRGWDKMPNRNDRRAERNGGSGIGMKRGMAELRKQNGDKTRNGVSRMGIKRGMAQPNTSSNITTSGYPCAIFPISAATGFASATFLNTATSTPDTGTTNTRLTRHRDYKHTPTKLALQLTLYRFVRLWSVTVFLWLSSVTKAWRHRC